MNTFDIDNPQWSAVTNYVEATTNVPTNRLYNKTQNVRKKTWIQNYNKELDKIYLSKLKEVIGDFKMDTLKSDKGENFYDAALRELEEETGIKKVIFINFVSIIIY